MKKQPSVYIIILNWNGYLDTIECVNSLKGIHYSNYKIIIVDNGSTNDSVKILREKFPLTTIIQNKRNLGFSGGCNTGIKYALRKSADYVLLLNNDTVVSKSFLAKLIEKGEKSGEIGILSPIIYFYDRKNVISSAGGVISYKSPYPFKDDNFQKVNNKLIMNDLYVDCIIGCSMLIKRKVFEKIGLYNDKYFLYAEDMDFSIRAKNSGFLLCVVAKSSIWHKVSGSSGGDGNIRKEYYNNRNLVHFSRDNLKFKDRIIFNYYFLLGRLHRIYKLLRRRDYAKGVAGFIGLVHGYLGITGQYNI